MANTPATEKLKEAMGKIGPQYYNENNNEYEILHGNKHAPYSAILGPDGEPLFTASNPAQVQDTDTESRIASLEGKIDGIIDGSTPASTQLTGSKIKVPTDIQEVRLIPDYKQLTNKANYLRKDELEIIYSPDLYWEEYKDVSLRIDNTHNEPVTLFFRIPDPPYENLKNLDGTDIKLDIPPETVNIVITSEDLPFLGHLPAYKFSFKILAKDVMPTDGSIHVFATKRKGL